MPRVPNANPLSMQREEEWPRHHVRECYHVSTGSCHREDEAIQEKTRLYGEFVAFYILHVSCVLLAIQMQVPFSGIPFVFWKFTFQNTK